MLCLIYLLVPTNPIKLEPIEGVFIYEKNQVLFNRICSFFVIVGLLLYVGYFKYHEYTSDKKIDDFIARIDKIPKKKSYW